MAVNVISGVSILNDVIGPIMRGPSSSHTAGPFFIGRAVRSILNDTVARATIRFDPDGSFAQVYRDQGSDVGFAAGLLGLAITDEQFHAALDAARTSGCCIGFELAPIDTIDHPNAVVIDVNSPGGKPLHIVATSIGGGQILLYEIDGTPIRHDGHRPQLLIKADANCDIVKWIENQLQTSTLTELSVRNNAADSRGNSVVCEGTLAALEMAYQQLQTEKCVSAYLLPALALITYQQSHPLLCSVKHLLEAADAAGGGLGALGLEYESKLLRKPVDQVRKIMAQRWQTMENAISSGLYGYEPRLKFLKPSARDIFHASHSGKTICGGVLSQACAAALAVMETNASGRIVCAAPTAGSAGIIPGVLFGLRQHRSLTDDQINAALFTAGVIGVLIATRATFGAEVCGCAVETGVAAAMAAGGLVQLGGGDIPEALDAAALCLINTLGLVCDPIGGVVEIPCHARNVAGVTHALAAADAVLGGFSAVLPLDEVIDTMLTVGQQISPKLRCTGLGGLAVTPMAKKLVQIRDESEARSLEAN